MPLKLWTCMPGKVVVPLTKINQAEDWTRVRHVAFACLSNLDRDVQQAIRKGLVFLRETKI